MSLDGKEVCVPLTWLGSGSYSHSYVFVNPFTRQRLALKVARRDAAHDAPMSIREEYELMHGLRSPHVVEAYNYFEHDDAFTMELMSFTLQDYWNSSDYPPPESDVRMDILRQVVEGVEDIHSQGVLHRDLSPGNVMLRQEGERLIAKLVDFGNSKRIGFDEARERPVVGYFNDKKGLVGVGFSGYDIPHEVYALTLLAFYTIHRMLFKGH